MEVVMVVMAVVVEVEVGNKCLDEGVMDWSLAQGLIMC